MSAQQKIREAYEEVEASDAIYQARLEGRRLEIEALDRALIIAKDGLLAAASLLETYAGGMTLDDNRRYYIAIESDEDNLGRTRIAVEEALRPVLATLGRV